MTTVACVWVKGNVPYTAEYVANLSAMVRRHIDRPYRMVCLTDRPDEVPHGIDPIAVPNLSPLPGWWSKLELFKPAHRLTGRVLYLDLDTLIVGDLAPVLDWPAPFAIVPDDTSSFQPRPPYRVVKRFNSSVMVFDGGIYPDLFEGWRGAVKAGLWGDQDLIGERYPSIDTMPAAWFPRLSTFSQAGTIPTGARVVLSKKPKNHVAAAQWPWFDAIWRAA